MNSSSVNVFEKYEIQQHFPLLEANDMQTFIPRLAMNFARIISFQVDKKTIFPKRFPIDGYSSFHVNENHLVVIYEGLYGKQYFNDLACLFNQFDPDLDAYYTDVGKNNNDMNDTCRFYALCFDADTFFKWIGSEEKYPVIKRDANNTELYRRSNLSSLNPVNHYPDHAIDIKIMECSPINVVRNRDIEITLLQWEVKHSDDQYNEFRDTSLKVYQKAKNTQPDRFFSLGVSGSTFHSMEKREDNEMLALVKDRIDNNANACVIHRESVIIRFALMTEETKNLIEDKFTGLLGSKKLFKMEESSDQANSSQSIRHYNIYVSFPSTELALYREMMQKRKGCDY